jgi:tetratricopeptide (TPR) repeat protein
LGLKQRVKVLTMGTLSARLVLASVALVLAVASPVMAAPNDPGALEEAKQAFEAGRREYRLARYAPALEHFTRAYRLIERPELLFNIAQCHKELGFLQDALRFFRSYLASAKPSLEAQQEVEAEIAQLKQQIAEIDKATSEAERVERVRALEEAQAARVGLELQRLELERSAAFQAARRSRALIIGGSVATALGVALLGAGGGLAADAVNTKSGVRDAALLGGPFDAEDQRRYDRANTASIALITIGGVAAVAGLAVLGRGIVDRRRAGSPR